MEDNVKKLINVVLGYVDILIGLQWGDEGKGKIVDWLVYKYKYDIVARFQGGPNAGHTLWCDAVTKIVLHTLPSGILNSFVKNFIGPGVVVCPTIFLKEIQNVSKILNLTQDQTRERIFVSKQAFLIHPYHKYLDVAIEKFKDKDSQGTTGRGIGPSYAGVKDRTNFRFGDFLAVPDFFNTARYIKFENSMRKVLEFYVQNYSYEMPDQEKMDKDLQDYKESLVELVNYVTFVDGFWLLNQILDGKKVLAEGAQGTMLDNNFGCYNNVTSSNTIAGGAPVGLGVPMKYFRKTIGVIKWYTTKVGGGEFPSEIFDSEIQALMQRAGGEVGATTGRPRRVGWLDIPQLRYALRINDVDELIITKVDINPLDTVEVVSSYVVNGKHTRDFPFDISEIEKTISDNLNITWRYEAGVPIIRTGLGLYLNYIKNQISDLDVKITHVSVGPGRDDLEEVVDL